MINLAALISIWLITRGRTVTQLWLLIAMLAFLLDTAVSLASGARFSVGWYLARINSLLCAGAVLGAFVFEFHRLQAHLSVVNLRLAELADTDVLTGLGNRRSFDRQLSLECARAARNHEPLALLLLDIDHFKAYNDSYGHQAGDACLQRVAGAIRDTLRRPGDFAARYGGEEFALILPDTDLAGAARIAESARKAVGHMQVQHGASSAGPHVSISCGVAELRLDKGMTARQLVGSADECLYEAKGQGRNRVVSELL
mgnify:CR=1 FL=1